MVSNVNNGQNGAATSAMENIFSKKSVLDFAVYAYNKMAKNPNGGTGNFSVVVGDNWRITMDSCMEENECRLCLNIYLEEKIGSRYCRIQKINTGYMDMATEYMSNGSWKSVVVYEIKSKIEMMVGRLLDSYIKDISDWSIKQWEKLTGMVYNAPIAEVDEDEVEENSHFGDDFDIDSGIERVADTIEKYLGNYTPSYLDQFGDCVITIYWDEFSDNDMKMLIEDNIFAMSVRDTLYDRGVIVNLSGFLVYDDGVYVTVDYDKMFNKVKTNVCCICGKTYEGYGNNADPLANGRCCDECNADVIKRRVEYRWASDILNPMIEKLGDNREMMQVSEGDVNGVPVTIELMRPRDKYMVFVKTDHEKGYEWFKLFNDYLEYAYNN